jgi:glycolate oxidase iron-sulfur subunit
MDSPRGRIYLMNLADQGEIPVDQVFGSHIDACLGCLACVTACPSGVQYDRLLEATRLQVERQVPRTRLDALVRKGIFAVFPFPARLRIAVTMGVLYRRTGLQALVHRLGLIRRLPAQLQAAEGLLPPRSVRSLFRRLPTHVPAAGPRRLKVGLLSGCAQRVLFGDVNAATIRVLAAEGCDVVIPSDQRCCGALSMHSGREEEAIRWARRTIDTFERYEVDVVVANVAGCGSAMKEYVELLRDDAEYAERAARFVAKVRDVSEVLTELPAVAPRHRIDLRVAYHDACHLSNGQRIRTQPRTLLKDVPGVEVLDIGEAEICCGSAGIYNLTQPDAAEELGRRKADNIMATAPQAVATGNAGCLLQIRRYLPDDLTLLHPIEILDASIRGVSITGRD